MGLPPLEQAKEGLSGTGDSLSPEASAVEWFSRGKKQKMEQTRRESVYFAQTRRQEGGSSTPMASARPPKSTAGLLLSGAKMNVLVGTREEAPAAQTFMKLGRGRSEGLE